MPIFLVVLLTLALLPLPWPEPLWGDGAPTAGRAAEALAVTAALFALPVGGLAALSAWAAVLLRRNPDDAYRVQRRFHRGRRWLGRAVLLAAGLSVAGAGWGWAVWHGWETLRLRPGVLLPGAELLVPAPYLLTLLMGWVFAYPAERALHDAGRSAPPPFWSWGGYVLYHARQFALIVLFPVGLFALQQGTARAFPRLAADPWYQAGTLLGLIAVFVLLPRLIKPFLGFVRLPAGPARDRLEATARRLGFRYTDLLLWETRGASANALVLGVVPAARYVVFTDRLLDGLEPDELDAVLGHEIGHVRHGHIPYYALFLLLSAAAAGAGFAGLEKWAGAAGYLPDAAGAGWLGAVPVLAMGLYLFTVFGLLSRTCERQADVFGCRAGSCGERPCGGHAAGRELPGGRPAVCPTGVRAFIRALDRVAALNGLHADPYAPRRWRERAAGRLKAWQHGPIPDRIEFLYRLADEPGLADTVDRGAFRFRVGLAALLAGAVAACGSLMGWDELWRML